LVESCERHGIPLTNAGRAIEAFEIDPEVSQTLSQTAFCRSP
jgi:hypothetical protein